jgi:hypothetical protein
MPMNASANSILAIKASGATPNLAYSMNRLNFYGDQPIPHGGWYTDRKIRLWDRSAGTWGGHNPHDKVVLEKLVEIVQLQGDIWHHSYNNVKSHLVKTRAYAHISAQAKYSSGKKVGLNWLQAIHLGAPNSQQKRQYLALRQIPPDLD